MPSNLECAAHEPPGGGLVPLDLAQAAVLLFAPLGRHLVEERAVYTPIEFVEIHGVNTFAEPLVFAAVDPGGDKIMRMAAQAAPIEAGAVHVPTHAPWLEEFKKEVLSFPASKHDDQIDALSQALQRAFAPGPPRVQFGRY